MRHFSAACLIVAIAAGPSAGWAVADPDGAFDRPMASAQVFEQRKDVDEVSRPLPPYGPATPVPFCSPGSPICP